MLCLNTVYIWYMLCIYINVIFDFYALHKIRQLLKLCIYRNHILYMYICMLVYRMWYIINYCSVSVSCVFSKKVCQLYKSTDQLVNAFLLSKTFLFARSTRRYHNKMYQVEELVIVISYRRPFTIHVNGDGSTIGSKDCCIIVKLLKSRMRRYPHISIASSHTSWICLIWRGRLELVYNLF